MIGLKFDLTDCGDFYESSNGAFSKYFHIPVNFDKKTALYMINIRNVDDKIFLYLNNVALKITNLIHVFDFNINIQFLEKYIQMSHDYKLLAIPDGNTLCIFDIAQIINNKSLKPNYSNAKIIFKNGGIPVMPSADVIENTSDLDVLFNGDPYKCILYGDRYIVVSKIEPLNYGSVIIYDFINKCTHIVNINKSIEKSTISLSEHGKYLLFCDIDERNIADNIEQSIWLVNLNNLKDNDNKRQQLLLTLNKNSIIHLNTFAISDNGELVCVLVSESNKCKMLLIDNSGDICIDEHGLDNNTGDPRHVMINIYDYSNLVKYDNAKALVITLWNKQTHIILIWIIMRCVKNKDMIYGPKILTFDYNNVELINTNGHDYIYKFSNRILIYDINKQLSLMMVNSILDTIKLEYIIPNIEANTNTLEYLVLYLLNDHYKVNENIKNISELQIPLLFDAVGSIEKKGNISNFCCDAMEYLIIKIVIVLYTPTNLKSFVKNMILIFNKLKTTKMFFTKIIEFSFGMNIADYL